MVDPDYWSNSDRKFYTFKLDNGYVEKYFKQKHKLQHGKIPLLAFSNFKYPYRKKHPMNIFKIIALNSRWDIEYCERLSGRFTRCLIYLYLCAGYFMLLEFQ